MRTRHHVSGCLLYRTFRKQTLVKDLQSLRLELTYSGGSFGAMYNTSEPLLLDVITNVTLLNTTIFDDTGNSSPSAQVTMPTMPLYIQASTTIMYIIVFLSGTIGNGLVIAVVTSQRDMRTSTNIFLANLALADLLVITLCMPTALTDVYADDVWYFGSLMCTLVPLLENTAANASVLTMLVIATERFHAICRPLKIRGTMMYSKTMKCIIVVTLWVISILFSVPFVYIAIYKDSQYVDGTPIKVCRQTVDKLWQQAYVVSLCVVFFAAPFILLVIIYGFIARTLAEEFQMEVKYMEDHRGRKQTNSRRKVVIMLSIVTVLFFILHFPFRFVSVWMIFVDSTTIINMGLEGLMNLLCFARIMFYTNSCINPIVYNLISTKFRWAFKKTFKCKKQLINRDQTFNSETLLPMRQQNTSRRSCLSSRLSDSIGYKNDKMACTETYCMLDNNQTE